MPNWVFNTLEIEGNKSDISKIKKQLNKPFTKESENWDMSSQSMEFKTYEYNNPIFAFWNIIAPTDLETYKLQNDPNEDKTKLFSGNNWYDWNCRNWGTKWDVAVSNDEQWPDTEILFEEPNSVIYKFNTAWSPPEPAITELSKQYPKLNLKLEYEEETGWGGTIVYRNGEAEIESEYGWKCRECDHMEEETPYCEDCEHDMCPECSYGEPDYDLWEKCPTHNVVLALAEKE